MVKIVGVSQMVVVLTNEEMNYLVIGLFNDLVDPAFVLLFVTLTFLPALFCFNSVIA